MVEQGAAQESATIENPPRAGQPSGVLASDGRRIASRKGAADRARRVAEHLSARVGQTEILRRVPDETIADLHASGLFALTTPPRYGGAGLGFDALFAAAVELSRVCASTGWTYGVLTGHAWMAALFPAEAQLEVFSKPDVLIASLLRLGGSEPVRADGGYEWRGATGRFCSGVDHADWLLARASVAGQDGHPQLRFFLIPRSDLAIVDDWYAVGLKGTGSKSLRVAETFIPEHRSVSFAAMQECRAPGSEVNPGSLYRAPFEPLFPFSLAGAAVGCAFAATDYYRNRMRGRAGDIADGTRLARLTAEVDAAFSTIAEHARWLSSEGFASGPTQRRKALRDLAIWVQRCRGVVNDVFQASGGSGVYEAEPIQRIWRDGNVAAAHVAFSDRSLASYGEALLSGVDGTA